MGFIIANKRNCKSHIKELHKKPSQKIEALSRFSNNLNDSQKSLVFNSIVKSQFVYCLLVWMFSSRTLNNMINEVHERALRAVLNDHMSNLKTLLQKNHDVLTTIEQK